ncbi:MAG: BlaI/MecI/CopY family transcriptional regulator [Bacteroidota bacterium]
MEHKLTKVEEEVMQLIWEIGPCTVSNLLAHMGEPKPPHSTISSVVRILEKKGFVDHKAYGRTYEYFPIVTQEDYSGQRLNNLMQNYFGGSVKKLVSFLVNKNEVNLNELGELMKDLENDENEEA